MDSETLLEEITNYCRTHRIAETTFGRLAINDGKLVVRLREGKSITLATLKRVREYMEAGGHDMNGRRKAPAPAPSAPASEPAAAEAGAAGAASGVAKRNFRFFDNRQKYLLFVNTCSEKQAVANRINQEFKNINPKPPALRLFDAGVGDGTVLTRVMRAMHARYPTMPFYCVGKEISLEDVRLALEKMQDRFFEHPATVFVMTNMNYSEAPWLRPRSPQAASSLIWKELALEGSSSHHFEEQITDLHDFLTDSWKTTVSEKSGNPVYERPVVLVIYRKDHRFLLDPIIPRPGTVEAEYDLVIASQPYRLKSPLEFKAKRVIGPLAMSLRAGGRLVGVHSYGRDPGMEIVQEIWPGENPFQHDRHAIMNAVKKELGASRRDLNFNTYSDSRSLFRYHMHTLPSEVGESIGTSTLFAAWNAAVYVAQIEDARLSDAVSDGRYLKATQEVLRKHGGLWFNDEAFVISRPFRQ